MQGYVPAEFISGKIVRFIVLPERTAPDPQYGGTVEQVGSVAKICLGVHCELRTDIKPADVGFSREVPSLGQVDGVSAAQIALAWRYAQSRKLKTLPIAGTPKHRRVLDTVAAASMILTAPGMEAVALLALQPGGLRINDLAGRHDRLDVCCAA